ncbi:50S ribosomal protein L9 [Aedoeadaptatus pacaensis]|uniref:50S ribosomal protein L9 n=1 Tax=Aedoeadaptatus pacaensis TaxID=1776390 RepID=UPI000837E5BA|nr:50S ribosomal protein L9 [Peptoniphilus pacaensis]
MKVILLKNVDKLGKEGDLVDAKSGYARNFLFPNKAAVEATPENMKNWKEMKAKEAADEAARIAEAEEQKKQLESKVVDLKAKGGANGKLFGAITAKDIADRMNDIFGVKIDKKKIVLAENIKTTGKHQVVVKLYGDVSADVDLVIDAE